MNGLPLGFFLVLNFAISWWNAWAAGRYWTEVKIVKGWPRLIVWAAVVMSAVGFTWVYLTLAALLALTFGYLEPHEAQAMFDLGWLILLPGLLGSGLVIWVHSLIVAWRRRTFGDSALALYNTVAQFHNIWEAASHAPGAFEDVLDHLSIGDDDADSIKGTLILIVVVLVLAGGILTTMSIARRADREHALDVWADFAL